MNLFYWHHGRIRHAQSRFFSHKKLLFAQSLQRNTSNRQQQICYTFWKIKHSKQLPSRFWLTNSQCFWRGCKLTCLCHSNATSVQKHTTKYHLQGCYPPLSQLLGWLFHHTYSTPPSMMLWWLENILTHSLDNRKQLTHSCPLNTRPSGWNHLQMKLAVILQDFASFAVPMSKSVATAWFYLSILLKCHQDARSPTAILYVPCTQTKLKSAESG